MYTVTERDATTDESLASSMGADVTEEIVARCRWRSGWIDDLNLSYRSYGIERCMPARNIIIMFVRPLVCSSGYEMYKQTAKPRSVCRLTGYVPLSIYIQIVNVIDLHFQGKRLESNTLASAYVQSVSRVGRHGGDGTDGLYQSP